VHKLQLLKSELSILGRIVDDEGIKMDPHKVDVILNWKTLTNRDLLHRFFFFFFFESSLFPPHCVQYARDPSCTVKIQANILNPLYIVSSAWLGVMDSKRGKSRERGPKAR
jgi:hypothetical protein